MPDYMPNSDADLMQWIKTFCEYAEAHAADLGLTEAELEAVTARRPIWEAAYNMHLMAQNAAMGARVEKDNQRGAIQAAIRPVAARIQSYAGTTDTDRAALGITIRRTTQQPSTVSESDRPIAFIDVSQRAKHLLRVENSTVSGGSKGKPSWAFGCEIYRKFGDPPVSDGSDLEYVGLATRGRAVIPYTAEDAGRTVHYMLRWVSKTGRPGSWSETESATVAA